MAILIAVAVGSSSLARAQEWIWARVPEHVPGSRRPAFALDAAGNTLLGRGEGTARLSKYDSQGNLVWLREGNAEDLAVDEAGNVYAFTSSSTKVRFGNLGPDGRWLDAGANERAAGPILVKLDSEGNAIWARHIVGGDQAMAAVYKISVGPTGRVCIVGDFLGQIGFPVEPDSGAAGTNGLPVWLGQEILPQDRFLAAYESDGSFRWVMHTDAEAIAVDRDGGVWLTGGFSGVREIVDSRGQTNRVTSRGPKDAYLARLDAQGRTEWFHPWSAGDSCVGRSVAFDAQGNSYFAVIRSTTPWGQPYVWEGHLVKMGRDGEIVWTLRVDTSQFTVSPSGEVYLVRGIQGQAEWGGASFVSQAPFNMMDILIGSVNTSGAFQWVRQMGLRDGGVAHALAVGPGSDLWMLGSFREHIVIGSKVLNVAGVDFFLARYGQGLPSILRQPESQRIAEGGTATFCLEVSAGADLRIQWSKDGRVLEENDHLLGTQTRCLTVQPVTVADAGIYTAELTSATHRITSAPATLGVGAETEFVGKRMLTNGWFELEFVGVPGRQYQIQTSDTAAFDSALSITNFYCGHGAIRVLDFDGADHTNRFYRAVRSSSP
ncbi:MAG: hypothetical protein IT581_13370 [Verrucomicrobiales bacterium]|nr:hypothetical protein [Verrucomicrobiales bacterium]